MGAHARTQNTAGNHPSKPSGATRAKSLTHFCLEGDVDGSFFSHLHSDEFLSRFAKPERLTQGTTLGERLGGSRLVFSFALRD